MDDDDEVLTADERVADAFSGATWLLLPTEVVPGLLADVGAEPLGEPTAWSGGTLAAVKAAAPGPESVADRDARALLVSPPLGVWTVVETRSERVLSPRRLATLSEQGPVHHFRTDIWVPCTAFTSYSGGEQVRHYELTFDNRVRDMSEKHTGTPLRAEERPLVLPDPRNGYDAFYYPLGVMHGLGVSIAALDAALPEPVQTYLVGG